MQVQSLAATATGVKCHLSQKPVTPVAYAHQDEDVGRAKTSSKPKKPTITGLRVREARVQKGLGNNELDELAGLSKGYSSSIESGRRKKGDRDAIQAIARVVDKPFDWLANIAGAQALPPPPLPLVPADASPSVVTEREAAVAAAVALDLNRQAIETIRTMRTDQAASPPDRLFFIEAALSEHRLLQRHAQAESKKS